MTQLALPLVMVFFGLMLMKPINSTGAHQKDEPPRLLKLSNLSFDGKLSKSFYADFRDVPSSAKSNIFKVMEY